MTAPVIRQIAVGSPGGDSPDVLYALGNDGTIWRLSLKLGQTQWYLLPPLPDTVEGPIDQGRTGPPAPLHRVAPDGGSEPGQ